MILRNAVERKAVVRMVQVRGRGRVFGSYASFLYRTRETYSLHSSIIRRRDMFSAVLNRWQA
jgi:hypothetical protein